VIFCAGGFSALAEPIKKGDLIIAADGGFVHTKALGLQPDAVLGDFDSLGFVPENANIFPVEKDDTDAMLAVKLGLREGCDRFLLYGSLDGPRLDHTVANIQTLSYLADRGKIGYLIGENQIVTLLQKGKLEFSQEAKGYLSVFALEGTASEVTLQGLRYSLEGAQLTSGFPLGVSNQFIGQAASVSVTEGRLLVIWQRDAGLPKRKETIDG
jgi:thiamine pyrophosphokinase